VKLLREPFNQTRLGRRFRSIALVEQLGPGLVTGAADDDPSGIATYSQAGAQFGYGILWTAVLTYPLMSSIQLVSAQIGRVTGCGLAKNMGETLWRPAVLALVALLFVANTINIGADLSAMAAAAELVAGRSDAHHLLLIGFALVSLLLQLFVPYRRYARYLKWLTLSLFSYVAVLLVVNVPWGEALAGMVWPNLPWQAAVTTIVAVFGTTISPYLFFWQSAQEVEEVAAKGERPLARAPREAPHELRRMRLDTFTGMAFSNLIALAIMIATAATLHAHGKTDIATAAEAAEALRPVAGDFAFLLFALGIVGTGLLAVPVLAGSAAFAIGEANGWKCGLEYKPWEAAGFYAVIGVATLLGIAFHWAGISAVKALYWSAVLNGVVAVPIMAAMMVVVSRHRVMGRFAGKGALLAFGWTATAVMAAATLAMFATWGS